MSTQGSERQTVGEQAIVIDSFRRQLGFQLTQSYRIKKAWQWHKDKHTNQWDRTANPEINPYIVVNCHTTRVPWQFTGGKAEDIQQVVLGQLGVYMQKRMTHDIHKGNSK
jgi:hypothetical protein